MYKCVSDLSAHATQTQAHACGDKRDGEWMQATRPQWCLTVCLCLCVHIHVCMCHTLPQHVPAAAAARGSSEGERRGSGAHSAERPLATMPARSLQHFGTPIAPCFSLCLSASRLSPNPRLFLSASIFLSSQRVCPYSRDISSPCRRGAAADCGDPW